MSKYTEVWAYLETLFDSEMTNQELLEKAREKFGLSPSVDVIRKRRKSTLPVKIEQTHEERVESEQQKLLSAQRKREETEEVRREARFKNLLDVISSSLKPLDFKQDKLVFKSGKGTEEEAVLDIGDTHLGKRTESYNLAVAQERFGRAVDSVIEITTLHRNAYPINHLNILWGGDIVDGDAIYATHAHHLDAHVVEQIFGAQPFLVARLADLANFFKSVKNYCVRGNHGRVSKEAHEDANFDNIFYYALKGATVHIKNMTWDIAKSWYNMVKVLNFTIMLVHGNQVRMDKNMPWYAVTMRILRWAVAQRLGRFDMVAFHHFHFTSWFTWGSKQVSINGTSVADDDFPLENMGLESGEKWHFYGIHPKRGVTWRYEIDLTDGSVKRVN